MQATALPAGWPSPTDIVFPPCAAGDRVAHLPKCGAGAGTPILPQNIRLSKSGTVVMIPTAPHALRVPRLFQESRHERRACGAGSWHFAGFSPGLCASLVPDGQSPAGNEL